jgi:hypothetical protein
MSDRATKLEHLHRIAVTVAGAHDVAEALQMIADSARLLVGAEMAAIGVPGQPGQPMAHFVVSGLNRQTIALAGQPPMGQGVLGVLLCEGRPLRLKDITQHAAYVGFPQHHPRMISFLGVPIQGRGEVVGDLYMANKIAAEEFSEEDQQLAEMLAAHAAVVIQTLRYHQKQEEIAVVRAQARLAPKIEDDVLQVLYGAGLLLGTLNFEDGEVCSRQIKDIQARLSDAIHHLREHLNSMASAPLR